MEGVLHALTPLLVLLPLGFIVGFVVFDAIGRRRSRRRRIERLARITAEFDALTRELERVAGLRVNVNMAIGPDPKSRERAKALLEECLDEQQRKDYEENGYFFAKGNETKRTYRIRNGQVLGLHKNTGAFLYSYCIGPAYQDRNYHPIPYMPPEDTMLANKLMIETKEAHWLRIAVQSRVY